MATTPTATPAAPGLPRASVRDTARVRGVVLAPMLAQGVILRRPADVERLLAGAPRPFTPAFWRVVRRVTLGDDARDDTAVTDLVAALRARANWVLVPRSRRRLRELAERLRGYVATAAPDSLAGLVRTLPAPRGAAAVGQVPHWLFAFDAAGTATFRALALLAAHPETLAAVRREARDLAGGPGPLTRATLLESVRLWPTTPTILRDSVEETTWADRFAPETWLDGRAAATEALVPFSAGPAACPGQTLVLDVAGTVLATLAAGGMALDPPDRLGWGPLPRTLAHTTVRLRVA